MNYTFEDLKNKTIIITGGSGFLGSQFIESFLNIGSNVVNLDKKINKKMFSHKKNFLNIRCNITKEEDVKKSLKKILRYFKKIDVLVNCAFSDYVPKNSKYKKFTFDNFNLEQWYSDLDVGLTGAFICSKIFGTEMNKNKKGNIINISSDLGIISPDQRIYKKLNFVKPVSYSVIKHGIIGLTKYTSTYWAGKVRCNSIAPGGMYNKQNKNFLNKLKKLIPLNRMAKKNEYNGLILFLASDLSSYINGSTIIADGGRTVW
ncbi:SDR family oxidoreductase [Candidatus Pelagibacter sp.]|nr:SDR family oxidoreductase [Candidatus Pelagibacter sp.]